MRFDRKKFFDGFRDRLDSTISQEQVEGLEFLLGSFEVDPNYQDVRLIAYALATVFHETAYTFQPVEEGFYLGDRQAKAHQKTLRYYPYYGRGYIQLTWKSNYAKASKVCGVDLVKHPDLALEPENAYLCLAVGLINGWYGKRIDSFINDTKTDYVNARRSVNVMDKAGIIAGYAVSFEKILRASLVKDSTAAHQPKPQTTSDPAHAGDFRDEGEGPADYPSAAAGEQPQAAQVAENTTNVNAGAGAGVPPDFKPEDLTLAAPPPSGILERAKMWLIGLGIGVPSIGGISETAKNYFAQDGSNLGTFFASAKVVFVALLPYLAGVAGLFIVFWGVKEVMKQASFLLQMYLNSRADTHNVFVKPTPAQPKAGAWRFAPLAALRQEPASAVEPEEGQPK